MYRKTLIAGLAIIAIPALPAAAFAQEGIDSPLSAIEIDPLTAATAIAPIIAPETAITAQTSADVIAPEASLTPVAEDSTLADDDLLQMRGGQAIVVGNQTLTAISNGNAFNGNYIAGSIALTDNALSNFNGLGNLVINTGAQNNLQSAMNVTINFAQ
jgi:hypothetical protein